MKHIVFTSAQYDALDKVLCITGMNSWAKLDQVRDGATRQYYDVIRDLDKGGKVMGMKAAIKQIFEGITLDVTAELSTMEIFALIELAQEIL